MNIDMMISALVYGIIVVFLGNFLLEEKLNMKKPISVISIIAYMVFLYFNSMVVDKFLKTTIMLIGLVFVYKIAYKKDWLQSSNTGIIAYIILFAAEFICGTLFSLASVYLNKNLMMIFYNSIFINLVVATLILLVTKLLKIFKIKPLNIINKHPDINTFIIFVILLLILSITLNKMELKEWDISSGIIIDILTFAIFLFIIYSLIRQRIKHSRFIKKYTQLADYSIVNDEMLEEYRLRSHEFKNQLAIIKTMTLPKNKELNEYVNTLIDKNENANGWISELSYIKLVGLRGLINYKVTECKNLGINISLTINKKISEETFENLNNKDKDDLYTIIGVYLDNAKEAALESKDKNINIDMCKKNESIVIAITNTYKGDIDETKISNYKYTTKGKNRGIGLYLVNKIINSNSKFKVERNITKKYFTQRLYTNISNKNKKQNKKQ